MDVNTNEKMSTPISQLINKSETEINSESIPDIVITPDSPVEILDTNGINYNQDIHTNAIKQIQQKQPLNNQLFRPEYGMMPPIKTQPINVVPVEKEEEEEVIVKSECQGDTFFDKIKSLIIITFLFVLLANKKVYLIIKQYLPFFNHFTSSLPRLILRGFILGLLYLTISKFLSK